MKNLYLLIFLFFGLNQVQAQWTYDPLINLPISVENGSQKDLRMETDGDGGVFIVWKDYRNGSPDIFIQRVDSFGVILWTLNGSEVCIHPSDQSTPAITSDGQGGVIIAWSDWRSGIERDLYAQRVDGNGNLLWMTDGALVSNKTEREHSEKIISDDNSGVIIIWEQQRLTNYTWDIWAQRLDSLGDPVWPVGGIPLCMEGSNRRNHRVQRDGEGGAFITWQDERTGDFDIYGQHIDADGTLLWDPNGLLICTAADAQTNAKIDPEKKEDGIYVSWVDKRNGLDYDIYANRIDSSGNVLWGTSGKPVATGVGNQSALDLLSNNKTNGLIVTWKDKRSGIYDIYAQKLDLDGDAQWTSNGVLVCGATGDQKNPNIISDKNGGAIIVWQDFRFANWDVYSQRVSYNGKMIWESDGVAICSAPGDQTSPKNAPDNNGGSIIAWEDTRTAFLPDIYMDHVWFQDTVTYPIDTTVTPVDTTIVDTTLFVSNIENINISVFPNPFTDVIHLKFNENIDASYSFKVIDAIGNVITTYSGIENTSDIQFNLSEYYLSNGIYYLVITENKNVSTVLLRK